MRAASCEYPLPSVFPETQALFARVLSGTFPAKISAARVPLRSQFATVKIPALRRAKNAASPRSGAPPTTAGKAGVSWATLALSLLTASAARAEVVIGVVLSSTGPKSELSDLIRDAAVAHAGPDIRLLIEDDACTAEGGAAAAARLIAAKAAIVIGHPCSNAAAAAAKAYAASGIPFVANGPRHPRLTTKRAGPAIFRLGGRDDRQAADTVAVYAPILIGEPIAVVHDRTAYARTLAEAVATGLRTHGVPNVTIDTIIAGERDYDALAVKLKAQGVKAVYFAGFPSEAAVVFDGLKRTGLTARFIGSDAQAGMKRPWLSVMTPRLLDRDQIDAALTRIFPAALSATNANTPLAASLTPMCDLTGDDPAPSFIPIPYPLE